MVSFLKSNSLDSKSLAVGRLPEEKLKPYQPWGNS